MLIYYSILFYFFRNDAPNQIQLTDELSPEKSRF